MAKKTVKRPAAHGKPSRSATPVRSKNKKPAGPVAKSRGKTAGKSIAKASLRIAKKSPAKPIEKPVLKARPASKVIAPAKPVDKRTNKSKPERPAKTVIPLAASKSATPAKTTVVAARISSVPPAMSTAVTVQSSPVNGKAQKSPRGFSAREIEHFRDLLLAKRRELIGDMSSMEREALRVGGGSNLSNLPIHMADMGTDNYEQEFTLGLVQKDRDLLKEINLALGKIALGTYGQCEGTAEPILKERLEYQPWARYSVEYQRKMERHGR